MTIDGAIRTPTVAGPVATSADVAASFVARPRANPKTIADIAGALVVALTLAGCSGSQFRDERDERDYLEHLSNPTPAQWARMKELQDKVDAERARKAAEADRLRLEELKKEEEEQKEKARRAAIDEARRVREADLAAIQSWLDTAAAWDRSGDRAKADEARAKAEEIRRGMRP
jgi:hypothetical protein